MAFQPAPGIVKLELRFTQNGQLTENVLHVQTPSVPTAADLEAIATSARISVSGLWMGALHTSISFVEVATTNMAIEGGEQFVLAVNPPVAGGVGGFRLPNEVSVAVRLKAASGGRNGSGRVFWQGLADGQTTATNFITTGTANNILAAIQDLIDALDALGYIVAILSRYLNNAERPIAVSFQPVSPSLFDFTLDSQRRRKPGNGS